MVCYLIHGVPAALPFVCPELGAPDERAVPELQVFADDVPRRLSEAEHRTPTFDLAQNAFLFRGGRFGARFLCEGGHTIRFHKNPNCEDEAFFDQLLYPVMAAVLWQRGFLVLHASAALSPDGAVLITGQSGAGKSTTIAALMERGWPLVADDLCALRIDDQGRLVVMRGSRHVHLFDEAARRVGIEVANLKPKIRHRAKLAVPAGHDVQALALPVHKIIALDHGAHFHTGAVQGRQKAAVLVKSVYGMVLPQRLAALTAPLSAALQQIAMRQIIRTSAHWTLDAVLAGVGYG